MESEYKTKRRMAYCLEQVWFPLSEDILAWETDFHDLMLYDHIRMVAYERAIKEVVKPGMVVVDIGTGTGILSLWALEAGALQVYGIDMNEAIIAKAKERIAKAGYANKYEAINKLSYNVELPQKADVVISEILGNLADNEDMTPILEDARKRFLKENGDFLSRYIETFLVPVESIKAHEQIKKRECRGINREYNLDDLMSKLEIKDQFNLYYDVILPKHAYLSDPQKVCEFHFKGKDKSEYEVQRSYIAQKEGIFTGFKGYFVAELSDRTTLDISGDNIESRDTSDCWKHCYLPVKNPFPVKKGDVIKLKYSRFYPKARNSVFRQCYSWQGVIVRDGKKIYSFCQRTG